METVRTFYLLAIADCATANFFPCCILWNMKFSLQFQNWFSLVNFFIKWGFSEKIFFLVLKKLLPQLSHKFVEWLCECEIKKKKKNCVISGYVHWIYHFRFRWKFFHKSVFFCKFCSKITMGVVNIIQILAL